LGTGELNLQGGTLQSTGAHTLANTFKAVTGTTSTIDTSAGEITHTGALSSDGTLQKTGNGVLHFSGNGGAFTGTIKNLAGDITFDASVNQSGAKYELASGTRLVGAAAGNVTIQIGALSGDTSSVVTASTLGTKTFEIGTNGDSTFAGKFVDGAGVVALAKSGSGTLTLTNTQDNTGTTTVNGGVLEIGNGGTAGELGTGAIQINTNGTLAFNRSNEVHLTQAIASTGTLEQRGSSVLYVEANNTAMAGTVLVESGTLQIGNSSGTSTYATANVGTATIENNATLVYNLTGDYTVTNNITGHGDILKLRPGILTYTGNNYNTGTVTLDQGSTLAIGDGAGTTDQTFSATKIHLSNANLDLNPGSGTKLSIGGGVTGSGNVTKNGDGTAILVGKTTASGTITINAGELHIGDGGDSGSVENSSILINTGSALAFNRTGTTVISARISGAGDIRQLGGNSGDGTVILSQDNLLSGFISIENHSTLQVGDGGKSGSLNYDNAPINVDIAEGATLAFSRTGSGLVTGSNLTITGAGNFEKRGAGTLTFNSAGQHTGATTVREGRLIIETSNLPASFIDPNGTGSLQAYDSGVLELRNGATPFDFEGRISGTGTIALGASSSIGADEFTQYNYKLSSSSLGRAADSALGTLQVEAKSNLYLGTNPSTTVQANTLNILSGGKLSGQGTLSGDLRNNLGGVVWIGDATGKTAAGQINVTGNVINEGRLDVALYQNADGTYASDTLHYTGSAQVASGSTVYFDITNLGGVLPANGTKINFVIDDDTSYNPLGSSATGAFAQINPALTNETLIYNNGAGFTLLFAKSINDIPGLTLRDGLSDFVRYLDDVRLGDTSNPALNVVNGLLGDENQSRAINNSSPAGLASMTSMSITMAHDDAATLRAHLESLRYDRAINGVDINIAPYIVATGSFGRNGSGMSDPAFDFNTYGGLVGIDHSFGPSLLVGLNVGYHHGTADLDDGGGKVKLDNARITAYGTYKFSDWVYLDAAVFGGYNSYEVNHTSTFGTATADPTGFDYGANVYLGTILPVSKNVHFTPYVGLEYVRADVDGFTETGTDAALRIDSFTQDSLRAKIGTGVNWIVPTGNDFSLRLALDLAYAYEILDTEADITGRYANDISGARPFKVNAASTPENSIMAGPIAEFGFDGNKSISLSYSLEYDLEDQYIHHLNATFRMRF
ncbi:MAG: autotransporter domain-containing protein, partial [Puniceicoccales bacterium]|jgi:autotransporter-associated beta strand protein|nr:autotransporter domain-containing protein [Puniceicoccales bacterium]